MLAVRLFPPPKGAFITLKMVWMTVEIAEKIELAAWEMNPTMFENKFDSRLTNSKRTEDMRSANLVIASDKSVTIEPMMDDDDTNKEM